MRNPQLRLYGLVPFDRSAKARWLLNEMGVEFQDQWLDRDKKEYESAEYLKVNPMGRVPALRVDDHTMFESGAICAYLADHFLDRGFAPALSSPDRMDYQKWMYFAGSTVEVFQLKIMIIEDIPQGAVYDDKFASLKADVEQAVQVLDQTLSKNQFLVGNRFSAADISVSYHLYWCTLWPELNQVIESYPSVVSYLNRMKERPLALKTKVFSYSD